MGNNYFTPDISRGTYERIIEVLAAQMNLSPDQFKRSYKIMPSVVKMSQYLDPGKSSYTFSPRKSADLVIPNTILLDQNDFFAASGIGIRLSRATFASNVYTNHGNYPVMTYPDPNYFTGTGTTAGDESDSLQCLVNGTLAINVNSDAMVDGILIQELLLNPQATYTATPLAYPQFGGSEVERGFFALTPQIILDASADNAIVISLANGAKGNIDGSVSMGITDSGVRNILHVLLNGWKVKNLAGVGSVSCAKA